MEGLDPELLRRLGDRATELAEVVGDAAGEMRSLLARCWLDSGAPALCDEIAQEARLLSSLASAKATQMELAAVGYYLPVNISGLLDRLSASLADGNGWSGMVGDNAMLTVIVGFSQIDGDGNGRVTAAELEAAVDDAALGADVRVAVQYLLDNPSLLAHAIGASDFHDRFHGPDEVLFSTPAFTVAGLQSFVQQNAVLRTLSDRAIFAELESAKNGELDGKLSTSDLEAILASTTASAEARSVAEYLLGDEAAWRWLQVDTDAGFGWWDADLVWPDGMLDYDTLLARTINQQAFAADPAGARGFVLSLAEQATWTDVSGKTSGIDIRLASDDGLRALAASALSDATTLSEQVNVVASLPESGGGVRNQLITFYYAELAGQMNDRMNLGLDSRDPTVEGHTGANWMQFAPWASNSVFPAITGDIRAYGQSPSSSDRQYAADGNQYIFGDVAIRYAAFLEAFPPGVPIDAAGIRDFFDRKHPLAEHIDEQNPTPLFGTGHSQLRDSFAYYLAAIESGDPELRQRYTMMGNILIATHEQAGAQHALAGIVDLDVGDDGWFRGTIGEIGGFLLEGSDEKVATNRMQLMVGFDRDPVSVSEDVPVTEHPTGNRVLDDPLDTTLNPEGRRSVDVGGVEVSFAGGAGDVPLSDIGGWGDLPPGSNMDPFPTDPAEWEDRAGFELSENDRALMEHFGRDPDDLPSTYGTDATNWADPHQRQWFISNLFQQMHADPVLFDGLDDLTLQSEWGGSLAYLPDTVGQVAR